MLTEKEMINHEPIQDDLEIRHKNLKLAYQELKKIWGTAECELLDAQQEVRLLLKERIKLNSEVVFYKGQCEGLKIGMEATIKEYNFFRDLCLSHKGKKRCPTTNSDTTPKPSNDNASKKSSVMAIYPSKS